MESSETKIYISLDLESPIMNAILPNNTFIIHDLNELPIHNNFILKKIKKFIKTYNEQVPWSESVQINDIFKFIQDGNDINILMQDYNFIGWAWQNKKIAESMLLEKHQIYTSKLLINKKFLFKKTNKGLLLGWVQEFKKYYKNKGFTQALAYVDDWNRGVLKSLTKSGYKIKNWNN